MINRQDAVLRELRYCPFDLKPGANGRVLLWWREENTWIAAFPTLQAAHDFIIGLEKGWPRNPGWDRSDTSIDLKPALYEYREKNEISSVRIFRKLERIRSLHAPRLGP